jgi:hypothetical protein
VIFGGFVDKKVRVRAGFGSGGPPAPDFMHNITSSPYHFHFFSFS